MLEKLVNGSESTTALGELRRVLASGVCEVDEGRQGNETVRVVRKDITIGADFPVCLASKEDLSRVHCTDATPLVR